MTTQDKIYKAISPILYNREAKGFYKPKWYAYADKSKGQAERSKIRSKTFPGIANRNNCPFYNI